MPKIEKDIQDRFFDILIDQKRGFEGTSINIYQKLVYMRYEEVIKNSFPLFINKVSKSELEEAVTKFMKATPDTPFVWQIPNDFRKFAKKKKLFHNRKFLYELMYYDWIEIEIYMKEYKLKEQKNFSFSNSYIMTKSARVKRFKHDIINGEFKNKRENFLVIYYDFGTDDVVFREINQLIYILLQKLNKKESIGEILETICKENDIDFDEAKKLLKEPLKELYFDRVFSK